MDRFRILDLFYGGLVTAVALIVLGVVAYFAGVLPAAWFLPLEVVLWVAALTAILVTATLYQQLRNEWIREQTDHHLLEAYREEHATIAFYEEAAAQADDEEARRVFARLLEDERRHLQMVELAMSRLRKEGSMA